MKIWSNAIVVVICVFLGLGGCQSTKNAEASRPVDQAADELKTEPISVPNSAAIATANEPAEANAAPSAVAESNIPAGEQPQIKFESTAYDFNDIKPESKNTAAYQFTNIGKGNLKILDIQTTCGCTVPELTKRDYMPGESGTIKVDFQASKIGGPVTKHLYVMSNDPNQKRIEILIKANVVVPIEVEPKTMQLSLDEADANVSEIRIYSKNNRPFSITRVESTNSAITADIDPNASESNFVIKPKVDMEKLKTNLNGYIKFHLAKSDIDEVTINYTTLAEFEIQPGALIIRSATPKQSERRELWVKSNYNKAFEIDSVSSKNGYIKMLEKEKLNNMYKVTLEITPPELQKIMFFNDTLTINIKNAKPLEIVCRGFFKRPSK